MGKCYAAAWHGGRSLWLTLVLLAHPVGRAQVRRQMLLKRLDVTVQSFKWSDKAKSQLDRIEADYQPKRMALQPTVEFTPQDVVFASRGVSHCPLHTHTHARACSRPFACRDGTVLFSPQVYWIVLSQI